MATDAEIRQMIAERMEGHEDVVHGALIQTLTYVLSRLDALEQENSLWRSQIAWLRSELGLPPQFDDSQQHDSAILGRIAELEAGAGGGGITIAQAREIAQEEDDRQVVTKREGTG